MTKVITQIEGPTTPLITTHEPPSRVQSVRLPGVMGLGGLGFRV